MRTILRRTAILLAGVAPLLAPRGSARAAPDTPAKGLRLTAEARPTPGGGLALQVVFRSADGAPVTFFVPESFGANAFPVWRFVRSDGAAFRPYPAPYQSMWTEGDQGSLVELTGARTWEASHAVDLVVAEGAGADDLEGMNPLPLDPGRYRVHCAYEKADATIPVGGPNFRLTHRTAQGLWTGRVEAAPVEIEVPRRPIVSLRIDAPREVPSAGAYPLTVVLRNDTASKQTLPGPLTVQASSKPKGNSVSLVSLGTPSRALAAGESQSLELAPGAELRFQVDLLGLTFRTQGQKALDGRLGALLGQGIFHLSAAFGPPGAPAPLESNGLWRSVAAEPSPR